MNKQKINLEKEQRDFEFWKHNCGYLIKKTTPGIIVDVLDSGDLPTESSAHSDVIKDAYSLGGYEISADVSEVVECLEFTSMDTIRGDPNLRSFEEDFTVVFEKAGISKEEYITITHRDGEKLVAVRVEGKWYQIKGAE